MHLKIAWLIEWLTVAERPVFMQGSGKREEGGQVMDLIDSPAMNKKQVMAGNNHM